MSVQVFYVFSNAGANLRASLEFVVGEVQRAPAILLSLSSDTCEILRGLALASHHYIGLCNCLDNEIDVGHVCAACLHAEIIAYVGYRKNTPQYA